MPTGDPANHILVTFTKPVMPSRYINVLHVHVPQPVVVPQKVLNYAATLPAAQPTVPCGRRFVSTETVKDDTAGWRT